MSQLNSLANLARSFSIGRRPSGRETRNGSISVSPNKGVGTERMPRKDKMKEIGHPGVSTVANEFGGMSANKGDRYGY